MLSLLRKDGDYLKNPESLFARVSKERYLSQTSFMEARVRRGISLIWRSIFEALELLKKGLKWRIGTGDKVQV